MKIFSVSAFELEVTTLSNQLLRSVRLGHGARYDGEVRLTLASDSCGFKVPATMAIKAAAPL